MTHQDLNHNEFNPYYGTYIKKSGALTLKEALAVNHIKILEFLGAIPHSKLEYRYTDGKWTIKEIIQHLIDTERVFAYRSMCISRKDKTLFPGFDQDEYVVNCNANQRTIDTLIEEYRSNRLATINLFNSFTNEMLTEIGTASNSNLSVRAVGFIILGHENHHCQVIQERYL